MSKQHGEEEQLVQHHAFQVETQVTHSAKNQAAPPPQERSKNTCSAKKQQQSWSASPKLPYRQQRGLTINSQPK